MKARDEPVDPIEFLRRAEDALPPPGAQERVLALLSASSFGSAAGGGAVGKSALAGGAVAFAGRSLWQLARRLATWSLLPLAAGLVIGVKGGAWFGSGSLERGSARSPTTTVAPLTSTPAPAAAASSISVLPPSPALATAVGASPSPPDKLEPSPRQLASDSLAQERAVLDRARQKLAMSEPEQALQFLEQHARRYPNGKLSEEREAMLISVLVSLGQSERATARGAAFVKRFPNSLMLSAVKAALAANSRQ